MFVLLFTRLAWQGIVCYTFQVYCRAKVSLLLWEKVAAVRLTDEELVLRLVTPHPPLTREPPKLISFVSGKPAAVLLPPLGKAFCAPRKSVYFS